MKKAILGLGQAWRSEDQFGILAVEFLKQQPELSHGVCDFLISQGNITELSDYFQSYNKILIIDALWIEENQNLHSTELSSSNLKNTNLQNTILQKVSLQSTTLQNANNEKPNDQLVYAKLDQLINDQLMDKNIGSHFFSLKEVYLMIRTLKLLKADIDFLGLPIKNKQIAVPLEAFEIFPFQAVKTRVLNWLNV